jgi:hypothetical protein
MRKRGLAVFAVCVLTIFLSAGSVNADAGITHVVKYTQIYTCILGPYPGVVGEWWQYCDGSWYGWGWPPGHSCTATETTIEESCGGGGDP